GVKHVHRKVFLPTYGVFDEERFVERGHEVRAFDTRFGRAAILICEDAWHSLTATIAALDGAQLLILPSASPARGTGKTEGEGESQGREVRRRHQRFTPVPRPSSSVPDSRGGAGRGRGRPARHRPRAGAPLARELPQGRGRGAPRLQEGDRGALGRRGLLAHR